MKNIISKHKIEIVYVVVILLVIIYGTVTAHAEVSSNIADEQVIIEEDKETTTPDTVPAELEEEPPKEVAEDVETETIKKEVSDNIVAVVVDEQLSEDIEQIENTDFSEVINILNMIVILLSSLIIGVGLLIGTIWCGKVFRWLE